MQDEYDPRALSVEQALERIATDVRPVSGFEQLPIRAALNRVLAGDIFSPMDVPAYTNSAMDGYALAAADLPASGQRELRVIGSVFAGQPFRGSLSRGECLRIMTGGMMAEGTDTVVKQEDVERRGDCVIVGPGHRAGQNVRQAGEDMASGQTVLQGGRLLCPADIGLLASLGIAEVRVSRRVRVAFFSTGDELRSVGEALGPGQLFDSNRYTLHGMLSRLGIDPVDMGVVRDRREEVAQAFREASAVADAVITTGGVSVGEADYVKETLESLGRVSFWKIAMKPGRPLAFGRVKDALFFGLPGNPVSTMVTFYQFVQPALQRLMGQSAQQDLRLKVPCTSPLKKARGRVDFQRGVLARDGSGGLTVRSTGPQGSAILSSMSQANCFIILPADWGDVPAGTEVEVQAYAGLV
jgi:molybdopterin molybdotransferase